MFRSRDNTEKSEIGELDKEAANAIDALIARGMTTEDAILHVEEMQEIGYRPLDATMEELKSVWQAHQAGVTNYTVELLRANREIAYAKLHETEHRLHHRGSSPHGDETGLNSDQSE